MLQPVLRQQIEESLIKAANAGGQDAALFLVVYYLNIVFDAEAACSWLVRAAELGSSSAMYLCYRIHKGLGIPVPDRIKDRIEHWLYTGTCWGSRIAFQDLHVLYPTLADAAGYILQKQGSCNGDVPFRDATMTGPFAMNFDSLDELAEKIRHDGRQVDEITLAGENGDRLLHLAAGTGNLAAVEALIRTHGADINVRNKKGETPFLAAVRSGSGQTMAKLFQLGADPTIASDSGQVPLHWLWGLERANRPAPSFEQEVQDLTTLAVGMSRGNRRVLNATADAVTTRINGFKDVKHVHRLQTHIFSELPAGTPLHWAVQRRSLAAVKALLAAGADPKTDSAGAVTTSGIAESKTVWHLAAAMHDDDILQMLIDNTRKREGVITPEKALERLPRKLLAAAIDGCASRSYANGRFERIARHGDSYKARTKKTFNLLWSLGLHDLGDGINLKATPLFLAVQAGQTDIVEALLQTMFQRDLHVRCGAGFTPLQESLNRRADDIYFLLRSRRADVLTKWGLRGGKHGTLALCALAGHYKTTVAADLIGSGVPVRSSAPDVLSPFVLAIHGGHFRMARFLLDQGADVNELQDHRVNMLSFSRLGRPTTALGLLLRTSDYSNLLPISWLLDQQKQSKLPSSLSPIVCPSVGMNIYHALGFVDEDGRDDDVVEQIFRLLWSTFPDCKLLNDYFHVSDNLGTIAPLYLAVETSNPQLVAAFLKAGADPTTKNSKGYGAVEMAVQFADDFERSVRNGTISEGLKPDKMASVPKMLARRRRVRDVLLEAVNLGASSDIS
jgi:ankyrin repeat protein